MLRVTFADEAERTLRDLMRRTGRSAADVLGDALGLEKKALAVRRAGGRVLVERDGRRFEVRLSARGVMQR